MTLRWILAALHLLGLGIGLGAIWARMRALRQPLDATGIRRVLSADDWWAVAALLWLSTGLVRWLASMEKPSSYYLHHPLFIAKLGLFLLIFVLELAPMRTFLGWRRSLRQGDAPDIRRAPAFARISAVQVLLVILMVVAATGVARGLGAQW